MNKINSHELSALFKKYQEHIDFSGIEINHVNQKGCGDDTMLHIVCRKNDFPAVVLLLKNDADVNLKGDCGFTALQWAISQENDDIVKLLLAHNADPFITNEFGENAFNILKRLKNKEKQKIIMKYLQSRERIKILF